jgi:hypothetical protein
LFVNIDKTHIKFSGGQALINNSLFGDLENVFMEIILTDIKKMALPILQFLFF